MSKKRLHLIIILGLIAGYAWLAYIVLQDNALHSNKTACIIKKISGVPCPSCGNTRSVIALMNGEFVQALTVNPLGIPVAGILIVFPFWLIYDIAFQKDTLYKGYMRFEQVMKIKPIAILLVVLLIINWIWNIQKEL